MRLAALLLLGACTEPLVEPPASSTLRLGARRDPCTTVTGETLMCFHRAGGGIDARVRELVGFDFEWGFETELRGDLEGSTFVVEQVVSQRPVPLDTMALVFPAAPADGSSPWFTTTKAGLDLKGTSIPCEPVRCSEILAASERVFSLHVQIAGPYALEVIAVD